jgi:hypothetical protein
VPGSDTVFSSRDTPVSRARRKQAEKIKNE